MAVALLAQLQASSDSVIQWLLQSFVKIRAACLEAQPSPSKSAEVDRRGREDRASNRANRQKSLLKHMQKDAAAETPITATIAAYLQQMQPVVGTEIHGRVITMELKAVQQVSQKKESQLQTDLLFQVCCGVRIESYAVLHDVMLA